MNAANNEDDDLFVSLDDQAYAAVSVPSEAEIRAALREGQRELREAAAAPRPCGRVNPKLRFRS